MATSGSKSAVSPLTRVESHIRVGVNGQAGSDGCVASADTEQSFLARRWLALTWRAAILSGFVFALGTAAATGFSTNAFFANFMLGLALFPISTYPVLWARRSLIINPPTLKPQTGILPLLVSTVADRRILQLLLSYLASGVAISAAYCLSVNVGAPEADLGLGRPTARHPWHLNERFIFVTLGNTLLLLVLGLRDVLGGNLRAVWPSKRYPFALAVQEALVGGLLNLKTWNSLTIAMTWTAAYTGLYTLSRSTIWRFLIVHFGGILRPFIINFAKTSRRSITSALSIHLAAVSVVTVAAVMIPVTVMMPYLVEPFAFDSFAKHSPLGPDRYVLTALRTKNPYYLNLTLMELLRIAHNESRRKAIFSDVATSPFLVLEIWQELLLIVGRAHYALATRHMVDGSGERAVRTTAQPSQPDPRQIALKQGDIFRPAQKPKSAVTSVLQTVLDGPASASPPAAVLQAMRSAADLKAKAIKEADGVQAQVMGRIEAMPVGSRVASQAKGMSQGISGLVGRSWAQRKVRLVVPNLTPAKRAVDLFAVLAVAALEEDTYGNVQQVLPATLEAIVRLRSALVGFENEALMQAHQLSKSGGVAADSVTKETKVAVVACEQAIRKIVVQYGTSMAALQFSPGVGQALAGLCRIRLEADGCVQG